MALNAPVSQGDVEVILKARNELRAGRYDETVALLEPLNRTSLSSPVARTEQQKLLGQAYIRLGDFPAAIAAFTNVIDFPRADPTTALVNRCHAYIQVNLLLDAQSDCAAARAELERALFSASDADTRALNFRRVSFAMVEADLALRSGQVRAARKTVDEAIEIVETDDSFDPAHYWSLYLLRARVMGETGEDIVAIDAIDALLPGIPQEERHAAIAARAGLHLQAGDVDAAVADWIEAAERIGADAEKAEYLFLACATLLRSDRASDAMAPCENATGLVADNAKYARAYRYATNKSRATTKSSAGE